MTKFTLSDILHGHCGTSFNISTVVILGFWLCKFNTGSLAWGCVCHRGLSLLFGCSNLIHVLKVTVSDVCGFNLIGCCFCRFKNGRSGVLLLVNFSLFISQFDVSAWCLKCTTHKGPNSDVVQ
jgi:hypothetical protein